MQTLDVDVQAEAERFLCQILGDFDRTGNWPFSPRVNNMSAYKAARNKRAMVEFLVDGGYLEIVQHTSTGTAPRRSYEATDKGRMLVTRPDPLPPIEHEMPVPFPQDPAQDAIYGYHLVFFRTHGRWPNGVERRRAFQGTQARKFSKEWRAQAYKELHENGTFVLINFTSGAYRYSCYVMPDLSPEYVGMEGRTFYAPPDKT
jgi:hypothetical protein